MERAIGEVFEFEGIKLKVVESVLGCMGCFFDAEKMCTANDCLVGECAICYREDKKSVNFKLLEE